MRKPQRSSSKSSQRSSQSDNRTNTRTGAKPRPAQPGANARGGSGQDGNRNAVRTAVKALQYPRSWRQVAGTHAINELVRVHPESVQVVLLQSNWRSSAELRELQEELLTKKVKIEEKPESFLHELCRSHQGAVAFSNLDLEFNYENLGWEDKGLVVALDGVEDTQNLGAVLRTSWLMGVNGLIIPEDRAVGLTATVHKVACGGAEHVPIYRANQFSQPFETLKQAGFWVFGLSHKAKKTIYDLNMPEKVIWVLGAEDKGLRTTTEKACDELVSIPQGNPQASYNVSVSAALALAETKRQWSLK